MAGHQKFIDSNNATIDAINEMAENTSNQEFKDKVEAEVNNLKLENEVFSLFPVINEAVKLLTEGNDQDAIITYYQILATYLKAHSSDIVDMKGSFYLTSIGRITALSSVGILVHK